MIDLNDKVPFMGTAESRGLVGAKWLLDNKEPCGFFHHNDLPITVYWDSTERELVLEAALKRAEARLNRLGLGLD